MSEHYDPSPAHGAHIQKKGEKWTLVLVRDLRHTPEQVWEAITDPDHLRERAPFVTEASLAIVGPVNLPWAGAPQPAETIVIRADAPYLLEYGDMRWKLEALGSGTRLTLWHSIDRRFISWGAAGWHICLDVPDHLLAGVPIGCLAGPDAMKFPGWQRLQTG